MICNVCHCEFAGWKHVCPQCKKPMDRSFREPGPAMPSIKYDDLVRHVETSGGRTEIVLKATRVRRRKKTYFPWLGFGFAWTDRMQGQSGGLVVDVSTTEVGQDQKWAFPGIGWGFAWAKTMEGFLSGNPLVLRTTRTGRSQNWAFPRIGWGYAWMESMTGECGTVLMVDLKTTRIGKHSEWMIPGIGWGFGWAREAVLTITKKT